MIVLRHAALALEHADEHAILVVCVRGEHLRLARGDQGVARDQWSHHTFFQLVESER